ncbi:sugar phosphate isomerase/epimerase family protein [Mucisphaera sp.]|uniref:sugar phosphate isomerase/epimerase family protein n=1 Tax=Mucisphaera sp. TaxID=2913024 RepID=UPI003D0A674F
MSAIPVALQLYSIRELARQDIVEAIKKTASWGYQGIEFAGFHGVAPTELKKLVDDLGLGVAGSHVSPEMLESDQLSKTLDDHLAVGCTNLIVPWIEEAMRDTEDACYKTAERFAKIAETLKAHGCRTGYHNHWFEFTPFDSGKTCWQIIGENTPEDFILQYDTGNGQAGGVDPVKTISAFPGRGTTLHLKEYAGELGAEGPDGLGKAVVGKGSTDWKAVLDAAKNVARAQWVIVEQEGHETLDELEAAKQCAENIKAMI